MDLELNGTAVKNALRTRWMGRTYRHFDTVDSTNNALADMVAAGDDCVPPAGTVVLSEYQSQGKGRLGRRWSAPPKTSLLLSILFRPDWPPERSYWLVMLTSLAAAEAMEAVCPVKVWVKWPNDLVIANGDAWRKVSGILLEGSMSPRGRLEKAIVGIGMNVNIAPGQLPEAETPPTSLLVASGQPVSRLSLLAEFLVRLEQYYEAAEGDRSPLAIWKRRLMTLGRVVEVTGIGGRPSIRGLAEDTNALGHLLVRGDSGRLHTVSAGDVTLRGGGEI